MTTRKIEKNHSLAESIYVAAFGLLGVLRTEKGIQLILYFALSFIFLCFFLRVSYLETLVLILAWLLVLTYEIFNTALEKALDYVSHKEYSPLIKKGKDFAAASVFVAACFANGFSLFILLNKIF